MRPWPTGGCRALVKIGTRLITCYAQLAIYVQLTEPCEQFGVASECCAHYPVHRRCWT